MEIRDPIHGPVEIAQPEKLILDHPLVQRLRRVRQLGFSETTFPGATHTRFLHSIGAMHLAGRAFDSVSRDLSGVPSTELARARTALRLAALLHDLGHPPLSHTGEVILPRRADIAHADHGPAGEPVSHEEMTRNLILASDLADLIRHATRGIGVGPEDVAAILGAPGSDDRFTFGGTSLLPLLRQLIASEVDVDRMDYLHRDSYFTGVSYGRFDHDWLLSHLGAHSRDGYYCLAIDSAAVFTFEDFLLSRHHMFLMVYAHHKTMAYHRMLARFLEGAGSSIRVPAEPVAFRECDDEWLLSILRVSDDPWAVRIRERRALSLVSESWGEDAAAIAAMRPALMPSLPASCEWVDSELDFSKYFPGGKASSESAHPLLVRQSRPGSRRAIVPVEEYSDLFVRQSPRRRVVRVYCGDEDIDACTRLLTTCFARMSSG
jgi:hypothetical protein